MSAITLTLTDAGLDAFTNPAHTGSAAVLITHVGLSQQHAGAPAQLAQLTALPGEFKRLTTFGGEVLKPSTIHVFVRDETADAYSLRSFGLYDAAGTLLAVVSSETPLMEKVPATTLLEAIDLAFVRAIDAEVNFGDTNFVNPPATTERIGVVELATNAETQAGERSDLAVTPFSLKATLTAWALNLAAKVHGHGINDIAGLADALAGRAAKVHDHDAADTKTGTFDPARIPELAISKVSNLAQALAGKAASIHQHAAEDIVSGVLAVGRIPLLAMDKINGLVDALAGKAAIVHQHAAEDIVAGVLAVGRIPAIAMEKVTGLAVSLAAKADLAGAIFTGAVRVRAGNQGAVELNSGSGTRPGLVAFFTPDGVRRGYVGFASSDEGGELVFQGETGWIWRFSNRPKFGTATPWDSANLDLATLATAGHTHDGLLVRSTYAPGTDLNTLITSGIIGVHSNPTAGLNFPVQLSGVLEVFATAASRVYQRYTTSSATLPDVYERTLLVATWSPWRKVVMDDLASTYAARGLIEMATDAEAITGTDQERAINPYVLKRRLDARAATSAETIAGALADKFITPASLWSFAKSIGPSGYAQIPGTPLIIQWGATNGAINEGQVTATLPIAFGGGCLFACAMPRNANSEGWADYSMQVVGRYLDRIVFFAQRAINASGAMSGYEWMALGRASGTPDPAYSSGGGTGGGTGGGGGGETNPEL